VSPTARRLLLLLALALAARGALHAASFALPVSNDDAILLLMGRAVLRGELATTLWNQPYNGALDAYLLAPLLAVFPHHAAYRLYQLLCAAALVWLVYRLARPLGGPRAGWAAAAAAAFGTPYMMLMTATGPPPNFLMPLVTGWPLVVWLEARAGTARPWRVFLAGAAAGLAIWTSALAVPAFAGIGFGLAVAGLAGSRARVAGGFAAGLLLGLVPLAASRLTGAAGTSVVTASSEVAAIRPLWLWSEGLESLGSALEGFLGLQVPLVVDGAERAGLPVLLVAALIAALLASLAAGSRTRTALPLWSWMLALVGAFFLARRTSADDLRYLYGCSAPLLALVGAGLAFLWERRRAAAVSAALGLALPWGWGGAALARAWSDPSHAEAIWQVPRLDDARAALEEIGIRSAYASLQIAGRLTIETEGRVLASQAWNERIPGDPLRFRDEVDLDPDAAWVLSTRLSRGMPRAGGFREILRGLGGSFQEHEAGSLVVFHGFQPPYDESRPVAPEAIAVTTLDGRGVGSAVLDRDPATAWTAAEGLARGSGLAVRVRPARRLTAVVLTVDLVRSPLAVPWVASVGGEVVAQGPARAGFQWVNSGPRAGRQAVLAIPLGERETDEVRLVFQGPGPRLSVSEVFLYGPGEEPRERAGEAAARDAYDSARSGRWEEAVRLYAQAIRLEPHRASHHGAWARARFRAEGRRLVDVESLTDGGPELVDVR
jgi:hypothetical protein